jgi:hypothetical protein
LKKFLKLPGNSLPEPSNSLPNAMLLIYQINGVCVAGSNRGPERQIALQTAKLRLNAESLALTNERRQEKFRANPKIETVAWTILRDRLTATVNEEQTEIAPSR